MNLDSTEAIKSAVEVGLGIASFRVGPISKELELGALKVAEVAGLSVMRHFSLIWPTGPEPLGPAGAFRTFALACPASRQYSTKAPIRAISGDKLDSVANQKCCLDAVPSQGRLFHERETHFPGSGLAASGLGFRHGDGICSS